MIAVDGSKINEVLKLVSAPPKPIAAKKKELDELEKLVGTKLPTETRAYLERPIDLWKDDADHPNIPDTSFLAGLPDVEAWLAKLSKPAQGHFQCICHFQGMIPMGAEIYVNDFFYAFAIIEPYQAKKLGGVMYWDEREIGTWAPSISAFLVKELNQYYEQVQSDDDRDRFEFPKWSKKKEPPKAKPLDKKTLKAWDAQWRSRLERYSRIWIASFLAGADPRRFLDVLPTESEWKREKKEVSKSYHRAMYWLLAHWLLDNQKELAEAIALTKKHPSKIVQAVRTYVEGRELPAKTKEKLDVLLERVREAK